MNFFGRFTEWVAASSELSVLMSRCDSLIISLTGINPKHLHPNIYKQLLENVKERSDAAAFIDERFNEHEAALIVLSMLYAASKEVNQPPFLDPNVYGAAIRRLRNEDKSRIRAVTSMDAFGISGMIDHPANASPTEPSFPAPPQVQSTNPGPVPPRPEPRVPSKPYGGPTAACPKCGNLMGVSSARFKRNITCVECAHEFPVGP